MAEVKMTGRASSLPSGLALGALTGMLATVVVTATGAHLIAKELMSQEHIGYCSIAALLSGTMLGAIVASGRVKHRKLLVCLLSGFTYFLILLSITALFFGGQYDGIPVTFITVSIGSLAAALLASREPGSKPKRKRKK